MSGRNKLADIPGKPLPERQSNLLADLWDEAKGSFARYGRRSGAQRDASLAMLNQAVDPNTDPLTGAGMKALGLAGLITHPLAFFPTREEWDQRLQAAGNDSRIGRSIGGFLSDLPSLIDPQMAAGGAALAAAPLLGKIPRQAITDAGVHTGWVLKDVDRGGMLSPSVSKGQMRAINSAMDNGKWSEAEVPIREMYATQSNVNPDFAEAAARHPGDLPLAVRVNGKIYLRDGHHRVVAAANDGKQTAKVRLVDIDNMGNKDDAQGDLLGELFKDDAWKNLTEAAPKTRKELLTQSYKETLPDGTERWVPGTMRSNPTTVPRFEPSMSIADVRRYIEQFGEPPPPRARGEIVTGKRKDVYPDGTVTPVPGLLRTKRPDSK